MTISGVELFAGGGGLLLGSSMAGVKHKLAVEWDKWAVSTIRENAMSGYPLVADIPVFQGDVRNVPWGELFVNQTIDLVSGGPPCQPFSLGGVARNADDPRDMFPATTSVIRDLRPRAFVIENVKGLTRASFSDYYEYIKLRLQHPELVSRNGESWFEHYSRLQKEHTSVRSDLQYHLVSALVNAADYGVPQQRHRIFLIGFRSDVDAGWSFPEPTHSAAALRKLQDSGEYWEKYEVSEKYRVPIRERSGSTADKLPWRTVRDALQDMPSPTQRGSNDWLDHRMQLGAKSYPGHTGSPLDGPAKTLKAGVHGVPGGENMLRYPNGRVRYFSTREAARLQTFPDRYALHGAWSEAMRQIGNAVPVRLAQIVMSSVVEHLEQDTALKVQAEVSQKRIARELLNG